MSCRGGPKTPRDGTRSCPSHAVVQRRFQKSTSFVLFFFSEANKRDAPHCTDVAAQAWSPPRAPPVRQLKIFYPPTLLKASHKQKCANFLRRSRPVCASACAANGMRCTPCPRLDARDAATVFHRLHALSSRLAHARNPTPRQLRRARRCCARMFLARSSLSNIDKHLDCDRRPSLAGCTPIGNAHAIARRGRRAATAAQAKKMAAPTSGHPDFLVRRAKRGQCASSSSSSA